MGLNRQAQHWTGAVQWGWRSSYTWRASVPDGVVLGFTPEFGLWVAQPPENDVILCGQPSFLRKSAVLTLPKTGVSQQLARGKFSFTVLES